MYYTTTTTADLNLPSSLEENEFDLHGLMCYVCELFGVTISGISRHNKQESHKWARWVIWKFCLEHGNFTLKQAAELFGDDRAYDHTSVMHARKKLEEDLVQYEWLRVIVDKVAKEIAPKTSKI